jgi:hypothetical protein
VNGFVKPTQVAPKARLLLIFICIFSSVQFHVRCILALDNAVTFSYIITNSVTHICIVHALYVQTSHLHLMLHCDTGNIRARSTRRETQTQWPNMMAQAQWNLIISCDKIVNDNRWDLECVKTSLSTDAETDGKTAEQ